jgi:hypothetical protein
MIHMYDSAGHAQMTYDRHNDVRCTFIQDALTLLFNTTDQYNTGPRDCRVRMMLPCLHWYCNVGYSYMTHDHHVAMMPGTIHFSTNTHLHSIILLLVHLLVIVLHNSTMQFNLNVPV